MNKKQLTTKRTPNPTTKAAKAGSANWVAASKREAIKKYRNTDQMKSTVAAKHDPARKRTHREGKWTTRWLVRSMSGGNAILHKGSKIKFTTVFPAMYCATEPLLTEKRIKLTRYVSHGNKRTWEHTNVYSIMPSISAICGRHVDGFYLLWCISRWYLGMVWMVCHIFNSVTIAPTSCWLLAVCSTITT